MPTYEYRCAACDHEFELFQSMSDSHKRKCPECKKMKLERLIGTGAAVIFKGSGFYQTDYRSDSYKEAAKKDKKSSDDSKDTKTESKDIAKSKSDNGKAPSKAEKKQSKPKG